MNYTVNQEERQGDEGLTIAEVVVNETGENDATGIAIALNQAVVPRSQWENREVTDGDEIDILVAAGWLRLPFPACSAEPATMPPKKTGMTAPIDAKEEGIDA